MFESIQIDNNYLILKSALVGILWGCVIIAVSVDLYHGIRKSKKHGEFTHSYGLRKTVEKTVSYLTFMLFMLIADVIMSLATSTLLPFGLAALPMFNIVGALVLTYNEWVSVREKSDQKMLNRINKSGSELSKMVIETLLIYKNNPGALEDLLKKYDENKTPKIVNQEGHEIEM